MDYDRTEDASRGVPWAGPASVVLGVLSGMLQVLGCFPLLGVAGPAFVFVVAVAGVFTGWLALTRNKHDAGQRTFGAIGLVLSMINALLGLGMLLLQLGLFATIVAFSMIGD